MKLINKKSGTGFIILVFFGVIAYGLSVNFPNIFDSRFALGTSSSNEQNEWRYKFRHLQGKVTGHFTAKSDTPKLIYSSEIETGTVTFKLYNAAGSLLATFPANNTTDTIEGFVKGEKYQVKAIAQKAKGRFDMKMQ